MPASNLSAQRRSRSKLCRALADTLNLLSGRIDANFIILLDRCEELVGTAARSDLAEFADELVDAINQPRVPANFLIALDEAARPLLADLRRRIPGFDDFSLKLGRAQTTKKSAIGERHTASEPVAIRLPEQDEKTILEPIEAAESAEIIESSETSPAPAPDSQESQSSTGAAKPKQPRTPPPRVAIKTEDVYKLIESTLSLTVTDGGQEPFPVRRPGTRPARAIDPASTRPDDPFAEPDVATPLEASAAVPAPVKKPRLAAALDWIARRLRAKPRADS